MCSIFGIGFFKEYTLINPDTITGVVSRLFRQAEVGGRHASGLSIMRANEVCVLRRPKSGSKLAASGEYLDFMQESLKDLDSGSNHLTSIIGHCRLPTQGCESNNLNNHPQVINNIIGVHNGIISNDGRLFEAFKEVLTRKAEVDTEIIFQLIMHFSRNHKTGTIDAIRKATPYLKGSYACAMQNTNHPYNLYLFRHFGPIKILYYPKEKLVFFATREHFITRAYEEFVKTGKSTPIELIDNQGIAFNLWNHTFSKFLFRDDRDAQELGKYVGQ